MYPQTKAEVLSILSKNLKNFARFNVTRVGLFGSFVREEQTAKSDIDILIDLHNDDFFNYCELLDYIEALFSERKVDIITKNSLDEISGIAILKEVEYVN
jgi:uncharacterized protein